MPPAFHRSVVSVCLVLSAAVVGCGGAFPAKADATPGVDAGGDAVTPQIALVAAVTGLTGLDSPNVHLWSLDAAGGLTSRAVAPGPEAAQHLARSADGRFLYVLGRKVAAYSVDAATAGLSVINEVDTVVDTAVTRWSGLAVDPSNRWLILSDTSSGVWVFALQTDGGIGRSLGPAVAGQGANDVAFDPSGKLVFAPWCAGDIVVRYSLDPDTGALLPQQPTVLSDPSRLVFHPSGKTTYVVNAKDITSFSYSAETGTLTEPEPVSYLPPEDLPIGQGFCTWSRMVVHPSGTFAYVSSWNGTSVAILSVAPSGRLSVVALEKFALFRAARELAIDPTGTFLLIGNGAASVQTFRIDPNDGRLTFVGAGVQGVNAQSPGALEFLP